MYTRQYYRNDGMVKGIRTDTYKQLTNEIIKTDGVLKLINHDNPKLDITDIEVHPNKYYYKHRDAIIPDLSDKKTVYSDFFISFLLGYQSFIPVKYNPEIKSYIQGINVLSPEFIKLVEILSTIGCLEKKT